MPSATRSDPRPAPAPDARRLAADLRTAIRGEERFDAGSRALYATDASNYRQVPTGVVLPRDVEDLVRAVEVARAPPGRDRGGRGAGGAPSPPGSSWRPAAWRGGRRGGEGDEGEAAARGGGDDGRGRVRQ